MHLLCMQQDGTLSDILTCRPELEQVLDQLCGIGRSKEPDDAVRGALAEATLMLVSSQVLLPVEVLAHSSFSLHWLKYSFSCTCNADRL